MFTISLSRGSEVCARRPRRGSGGIGGRGSVRLAKMRGSTATGPATARSTGCAIFGHCGRLTHRSTLAILKIGSSKKTSLIGSTNNQEAATLVAQKASVYPQQQRVVLH